MVNGFNLEQMIFGGLVIGILLILLNLLWMLLLESHLLKYMEMRDVVMDKTILDSQEMMEIKNH
jgi:hypothetical protein